MASTSSEPAGTAATPSQASDPTPIPQPSTSTTQYTPSGIPIEMNSLPSEFASRPSQPERFDTAAEDLPVLDGSTVSRQANDEGRDDGDAAAAPTSSTPRDELQTVSEPPSSSKASAPKPSNIDTAIASSTPTIKRMQTNPETPAIALAPETPIVSVNPSEGSVVLVTLMLTTGSRYSFRIDPKYLKRRNIGAQDEDKDPWEISVYTMKELLWRDWRDDWEARPTSPSYIRLIHLGRMLDDKVPLKDCRFNNTTPNVVHMTVRPSEVGDDDDHKMGKSANRHDRDDGATRAGCRCCAVM